MIDFVCPKCGAALSSPSGLAGGRETCPTCGNVCRVPSALDSPSAPLDRPAAAQTTTAQVPPTVLQLPVEREVRLSLSQTRIAIAICASTGIIAALLPWCQRPILESRYGTPYENPRVMYAEDAIASVEEDRWHVIVLYAISIIFALAEGIRKPLLGWTRLTAVAAAVLARFIVIYSFIMLERAISCLGDIDAAVALILL